MQKNRLLAAAALGALAVGLCCGPVAPTQGSDIAAAEIAARAAAALIATVRAKTPQFPSNRTPTPDPPPGDTASLDLLLRALYEGVSHAPDKEPDWRRLEPLFVPGALLMPPRHGGGSSWKALSFDEFREAARQGIAQRREQGKPSGFIEQEIGRETTVYGNFTVVLSAYAARFRPDDEKPFLRGVNCIQAVRAGERWAIVSIVWDTEGPDNPIPERLLHGP